MLGDLVCVGKRRGSACAYDHVDDEAFAVHAELHGFGDAKSRFEEAYRDCLVDVDVVVYCEGDVVDVVGGRVESH